MRSNELLKTYLNSFYKQNYCDFFKSFSLILKKVAVDKYIKHHYNYFVRQMRIVVYNQYLEPYQTVTLENMANTFGVSLQFIDSELSEFISTGHLSCRIDKVHGKV